MQARGNSLSLSLGKPRHLQQQAFTIVELLIVIVVIAVLATISMVAYNGIQNRARDTAIKSDLSNIAKKYQLYYIDAGVYPYGNTLNTGAAFTIRVSQSSYDTSAPYNLLNCTDTTINGSNYAVLALSKSGKKFYISSTTGGVQEYTGASSWLSTANCTDVLPSSAGNGAGYATSTSWRAWTQ